MFVIDTEKSVANKSSKFGKTNRLKLNSCHKTRLKKNLLLWYFDLRSWTDLISLLEIIKKHEYNTVKIAIILYVPL